MSAEEKEARHLAAIVLAEAREQYDPSMTHGTRAYRIFALASDKMARKTVFYVRLRRFDRAEISAQAHQLLVERRQNLLRLRDRDATKKVAS